MKNKLGEDFLLTGETNLLFLSFFGFVLFRFFFLLGELFAMSHTGLTS